MSDWDDLVDAGWENADGSMSEKFWLSCETDEDAQVTEYDAPSLTYSGIAKTIFYTLKTIIYFIDFINIALRYCCRFKVKKCNIVSTS